MILESCVLGKTELYTAKRLRLQLTILCAKVGKLHYRESGPVQSDIIGSSAGYSTNWNYALIYFQDPNLVFLQLKKALYIFSTQGTDFLLYFKDARCNKILRLKYKSMFKSVFERRKLLFAVPSCDIRRCVIKYLYRTRLVSFFGSIGSIFMFLLFKQTVWWCEMSTTTDI